MTDDEVNEVCGDLLRRAEACDGLAANAVGAEERRVKAKASAYRHAEELLRMAWRRSREAAK